MSLFDKLMGRNLPERRDGRRIYFRLLEQSRTPALFRHGGFADDYDGRIDTIALHMSVMMERLRSEGEDGRLLNQALFDEMKDDFEVSLREEGISDTGVKRRIKPMIGHFYDRLKHYTDALQSDAPVVNLSDTLVIDRAEDGTPSNFARKVSAYAVAWLESLKPLPMSALTKARFYFPEV